jgi:hypothetical protein
MYFFLIAIYCSQSSLHSETYTPIFTASLTKRQTNPSWSLRVSPRIRLCRFSCRSQTSGRLTLSASPSTSVLAGGGRVALCPNRILFVSVRFIVAIVYSLCGSPTAPGNFVSLHGFGNRTLSANRLLDICFLPERRHAPQCPASQFVVLFQLNRCSRKANL